MQTTTAQFDEIAQGYVRPLSWGLRASFDKAFDPAITFFELDTSLLDGPDLLSPDGTPNILPWDQYEYTDYSDRVISIEISQEQVEPYSVVQSIADVTLNNFDDYFTPNAGSPIDAYILPKRPFRLLLGFNGESLPQFVGLSTSTPDISKTGKTAKFHLIDFMSYLFDREIHDSDLLLDVSTAEAIDYLFQSVGLLPSQYSLDETSFNRIPFFYVDKGRKLGSVIKELMEAEQGRLYMDEFGVIRFLSRQNFETTSVYSFDTRNTIDYSVSKEDDVINSTRFECDILAEQVKQSIYVLSEKILVKAGSTAEYWISYNDPITAVTTPTYSAITITDSYFTSTSDVNGEIPYTSITISSIDNFSKASKIVFSNGGATDAYVYAMEVFGTPVKVIDEIIVENKDQTSIDAYDERRYELKTTYIQDRDSAESKSAVMIDDYKDFGSILEIDIKGSPALQIGDVVTLDLDTYAGDATITKIVQILSDAKYTQRLTVKQREFRVYFILSSDSEARSLLDGTDVLAP